MTNTMVLLTVKQVAAKLNCHTSYVWRLARENPTFPQPVRLTTTGERIGPGERSRATRWVDEQLNTWINSQSKGENVGPEEAGLSGGEVHRDPEHEEPAQG